MYAELPEGEILRAVQRFVPQAPQMEALGVFLNQQVKDRFSSQGDSGGSHWTAKLFQDGRAILTGRTGALLDTFFSSSTEDSATVANPLRYSKVQQAGTVGKGGTLPDIVPKRAKALFVPITDKAWYAYRAGLRSPRIVRNYGTVSIQVDKPKTVFDSLIRGRFVNGKVEPENADFLFLMKVSIPPRPMLPTSEREVANAMAFLVDSLTGSPLNN